MSMLAALPEPLPQAWIEKLFERLRGQLGDKLALALGGAKVDVVQQEWAAGLAGFSGRELARGLAAVRTRRFAPTLGEFAQLCRPALDPEYAWLEAQDGLQARERGEVGEWSHPAVWRAASALAFEVRNRSFAAARRQWERALDREFARGWGDEVPPVAARLENKPAVRAIPPELRKQLAELSRKFIRK